MPRINDGGVDLADAIQLVAAQRPDMFLIFREDLPDADDPAQALRDGFGAEPGDEVFELRMTGPGEVRVAILEARRDVGGVIGLYNSFLEWQTLITQ